MAYIPSPPSGVQSLEELSDWVYRELLRLSESNEVEWVLFQVRHQAPIRVKEGLVAYADGTNWNPGAGRGLYEYKSGAWSKL